MMMKPTPSLSKESWPGILTYLVGAIDEGGEKFKAINLTADGALLEAVDPQFFASRSEIGKVGGTIALKFCRQLGPGPEGAVNPATLRPSEAGETCARKLWYKRWNDGCSLPTSTGLRMKFLYGDAIEALWLGLLKATGFPFADSRLEVAYTAKGIHVEGTADAWVKVYDDVEHVMDVKSMSKYAFSQFTTKGLDEHDPFGYAFQLSAYDCGRDGMAIGLVLAVCKETGEAVLAACRLPPMMQSPALEAARMGRLSIDAPRPERIPPKPLGSGGNMALSTKCNYCSFREHCYSPEEGGDGIKWYQYSNGPVGLVKVVKEPRVPLLTPPEVA